MANVLADPTTTSTATGAVQAYLVRKALTRLERDFHFLKFGLTTELPMQGPQVTWYRWTNLTAATTALTLDVNPSPTWLSNASQSATVGLWGAFVPVGESIGLYKASDPMEEIANLVGYHAALSLDTICRNYLFGNAYGDENPTNDGVIHPSTYWNGKQGGFSMLFISGTGANLTTAQTISILSAVSKAPEANSEWGMSFKRIDAAVAQLRQNAAPAFDDGLYALITSPKGANQLMRDPEWQNMNQFNGRAELEQGRIMGTELHGAKMYVTQNLFKSNSSFISMCSVTAAFNLICGKEAYGITGFKVGGSKTKTKGFEIVRKTSGPSDTSNPLSLYDTIGWKAHFISKVLDQNRGYWVVTLEA